MEFALVLLVIAAAFIYHPWPSPFSYPPSNWVPAPSQTVFVEGGQYEIPAAWRTGFANEHIDAVRSSGGGATRFRSIRAGSCDRSITAECGEVRRGAR